MTLCGFDSLKKMIYFLIKLSKILIAEKLEPGHISYCTEKNNSKKNNNDY